MTLVNRCEICSGEPAWYVSRYGDGVIKVACNEHLDAVAHALQRSAGTTLLTLVRSKVPA